MITGAHAIIFSQNAEATRAFLRDTRDVAEERWGLTTAFRLPGGGELALYEPRHPRPAQVEPGRSG